jgi:hypothetical protein
MAEVVGLAASIAGLVTLADLVFSKGYGFIKASKGAEKSVEHLIDEVNNLSGVLHSLSNVVERLEAENAAFDPSSQIHHIQACFETLTQIKKQLDKTVPPAPLSSWNKIKWPLKKAETDELLKDIDRHKTNMTLALTAKEM